MLSAKEREEMIDWLMVAQRCTREFWKKQSDQVILLNYKESCLVRDDSDEKT